MSLLVGDFDLMETCEQTMLPYLIILSLLVGDFDLMETAL